MYLLRLAAAATLCLAAACTTAAAEDQPTQHILVSFDGAHDNALWERSRSIAAETGARFTYFLSCVYLLSPETRGEYKPPESAPRRSNVGFGRSAEDVAARLGQIVLAAGEGHEMANHGCGHFDGSEWTAGEWKREFAEFDRIMAEAWSINGIEGEPESWRDLAASMSRGFRAPYLATGRGLTEAMTARSFAYDASTVSRGIAAPRVNGGLAEFALPLIPEGPNARPVIAMDYNLFVRHSAGIENPDRDGVFTERAYRAFRDAFDAEYRGERRPLQLGFHFVEMNGGAYWAAMERLLRETCGLPDVACVSYVDWLLEQRLRPSAGG